MRRGAFRKPGPSLGALVALLFAACAHAPTPGAPAAEVRELIARQAAAWSRGDVDAFCAAYAEDAVFVSPSGVTRGRAEVLARYRQKYPDARAMGRLELDVLDVRQTADAVSVGATWALTYPDKPREEGHTVIVFVRTPVGWRIVHDASM